MSLSHLKVMATAIKLLWMIFSLKICFDFGFWAFQLFEQLRNPHLITLMVVDFMNSFLNRFLKIPFDFSFSFFIALFFFL